MFLILSIAVALSATLVASDNQYVLNGFNALPANNVYAPKELFSIDITPDNNASMTTFFDKVCETRASYLYRYNSVSLFSPNGIYRNATNARNTLSCDAVVTCMQTTMINETFVNVYDLRLENLSLFYNNQVHNMTGYFNYHLSQAFRFVRETQTGKVLGIIPSFFESLDVRMLKTAIAEVFNSNFEFDSTGSAVSVDTGMTGTHNTEHSARRSADILVVNSRFTGSNVTAWHIPANFDDELHPLSSFTHATFNATTGLLMQSFERTTLGFNTTAVALKMNYTSIKINREKELIINFALSSDATLIREIEYSPHKRNLPEDIARHIIPVNLGAMPLSRQISDNFDFDIWNNRQDERQDHHHVSRRHGRVHLPKPSPSKPHNGTFPWLHKESRWDSNSTAEYELLEPMEQRERDLEIYPHSKSFIANSKIGWDFFRLDVAVGAFAGLTDEQCLVPSFKAFSSIAVDGTAFGFDFNLLDAQVSAEHSVIGHRFDVSTNVTVFGTNINEDEPIVDCKAWDMAVRDVFTLDHFDQSFSIPVYFFTASINIKAQGTYQPVVDAKFCPEPSAYADLQNKVEVHGTGTATIGWSFLGMSMTTKADLKAQIGPDFSVRTDQSCAACVGVGVGHDDFEFVSTINVHAFGFQKEYHLDNLNLPSVPFSSNLDHCNRGLNRNMSLPRFF